MLKKILLEQQNPEGYDGRSEVRFTVREISPLTLPGKS